MTATPGDGKQKLKVILSSIVLTFTCVVVGGAFIGLQFTSNPITKRILDNVHWTTAYLGGAILALIGCIYGPQRDRTTRICFTIGMFSYAIGQILWDIQVLIDWNPFPGPSDIFFLGLGLFFAIGLVLSLRTREAGDARSMILDAGSLSLAVLALTMALYLPKKGDTTALQLAVMAAYPVELLAGASLAILLPLKLRLKWSPKWAFVAVALTANGGLWMHWNALTLDNGLGDGTLFNAGFSVTAILLGTGALIWDPRDAHRPELEIRSEQILRSLPLLLVGIAAVGGVLSWMIPDLLFSVRLWTSIGASAVIVLAMVRQSYLLADRDRLLIAEREAASSQRKFSTLFDNAGDAILLMDDLTIIDCNRRAEEVFGANREQLIGKSPIDYSPEHQPDGPSLEIGKRLINEALAGRPQSFEWKHIRADGQEFDGEVSLNAVEINGKVSIQAFVRDVTMQRRAVRQIRDFAQRLSLATNAARIGTWDWHIAENELYWDSQTYSMYEMSPQPFLKIDDWLSRMTDADRSRASQALNATLTDGRDFILDFCVTERNGKEKNIEARGVLQRNIQGIPDRLIGIQHDVTESHTMTREREKLIQELEARNQEMQRFTYTASHDLKSPLVTIKGFLGMLEKDLTENDMAAVRDDIRRIGSATDKMNKLLNDLLELSRAGRTANPPRLVAMQRLVEETLELLEGVIKTSGAEVHFDNSLPMVWADAPRIKTVWQNLIENAIKYAKRGENPEIKIGVAPHANGYAFYVKDQGIGIDPRYHERVFEQFHKLDTTSDGSGIGLALVRRILEAHNGRVWIESEGPDQGTTAWFLLPRPPLGEPNGN